MNMTNTTELTGTLGPYRIVSKLGQGGMGAVYKAIHETLERPVALKILPGELSTNPEYISRFLREARVAATLRHENIVAVYDAGQQGDRYYIAMELIEGSSLGKYLEEKGGALEEQEGLELLLQAARGLQIAHQRSLVHRDIKPDNMLLDPSHKVLRIVDFGLVMESASTTQLTATGACLGTPKYMSPEQADGEKADARSDIYSLGVTFFNVFTGVAPFQSQSVMNLLFKHKFEPPPEPRVLKPTLSIGTSNLILTMMAKAKEDRPQDAAQLIELIELARQGKPVPPPKPYTPPSGVQAQTALEATVVRPGNAAGSAAASHSRAWLFGAGAAALLLLGGGLAVLALRGGERSGEGRPEQPGLGIKQPIEAPRKDGTPEEPSSSGEQVHSPPRNPEDPRPADGAEETSRAAERLALEAKALEEAGNDLGALAKYEESNRLKADPEVSARIREVQFRQLKSQAEAYTKEGKPLLALAKAREAQQYGDASALLAQLAKLQSAQDAGRAAEEAFAAGRFAEAVAFYEQAQAVDAPETERAALARKLNEARFQHYQRQGEKAAAAGDPNGAIKSWQQALAIRADPGLARRVEDLGRQALLEGEFQTYLGAGNSSLEEGWRLYQEGRFTEAQARLKAAEVGYRKAQEKRRGDPRLAGRMQRRQALEKLLEAEEARAREDLPQALALYDEAARLEPLFLPAVVKRKAELARAKSNPSAVLAQIRPLVQEDRLDAALAAVATAQRAQPGERAFEDLAAGLGKLKNIQRCLGKEGLPAILDRAIDNAEQASRIEGLDRYGRKLIERLQAWKSDCSTGLSEARQNLLDGKYLLLDEPVRQGPQIAQLLADKLGLAREHYQEEAKDEDKGVEVRGPFGVRVGKRGDREKAARFRRIASTFEELRLEALRHGR